MQAALVSAITLIIVVGTGLARGQTIDFEDYPEDQEISTQYRNDFGVEFAIADFNGDEIPGSYPRIAEIGHPLRSFQGCHPDGIDDGCFHEDMNRPGFSRQFVGSDSSSSRTRSVTRFHCSHADAWDCRTTRCS